jgi:hypothetical protein
LNDEALPIMISWGGNNLPLATDIVDQGNLGGKYMLPSIFTHSMS